MHNKTRPWVTTKILKIRIGLLPFNYLIGQQQCVECEKYDKTVAFTVRVKSHIRLFQKHEKSKSFEARADREALICCLFS